MTLALILFAGWALASCSGKGGGAGKKVVAVSYPAHKWIVEQIAGDDFEVVVLLPPGADSETFDPDMRTMSRLQEADLYLTTSTIGFEDAMTRRLRQTNPDLRIVDVSTGVDFIGGTHAVASGHAHEDAGVADPHILGSYVNAMTVGRNMALALDSVRRLSATDDAESPYMRNLASLLADIGRRQAAAKSMIDSAGAVGGAFVVMHPSLSYYAADFGLRQVALERDGKEPSPAQWAERMAEAISSHPRVLFYEQGHSEGQAREVARSLGVDAVGITLTGEDFLDRLDAVTRSFTSSSASSTDE